MIFEKEIYSYDDARRLAKKRLPKMIFDYIDGSAGNEYGEAYNRSEIQKIRLQPRILKNVMERNIKTKLFGNDIDLPFGISPMGMCNLAGPKADFYLAKYAAAKNIPIGVSTVASTSLEQMAEWSEGKTWFQLYYTGERETTYRLLDRAKNAGYTTLVFTVDVPEIGIRPRELKHKYTYPFRMSASQFIDFALHPFWSLPTLFAGPPDMGNFGGKNGTFERSNSRAGADWNLLKDIREYWEGNLVVKGVLSPEDAISLKQEGVDAIQVSSHGGRQMDGAPAPIHALREIRNVIGEDYPLLFDSGLRSGEDIIKAYAYGADYTFVGRPFSFSYAASGEHGIESYGNILKNEISVTLAQLGLTDINHVDEAALCKF